ncbi:MAG TPA: outer membrane lipoprotein carrier protein LolA [Turneriella sp.]|nr:outer membrane lipoprotein carrier protein LolA [Turneriella sp.]
MVKFFVNPSLLIALFLLFIFAPLRADKFVHPVDIARQMQAKFKTLKTYQANFTLNIKDMNKTKVSSGVATYAEGGKLNFTFNQPAGDLIVSNGQMLYVYVSRLRAVGKQPLKNKDKDGKPLFVAGTAEGLSNLFRRYHYRFDTPEQPRDVEGGKYFVLELKEKEITGGYDKITLFVKSDSYLIEKMHASSPSGRTVELTFSNIRLNPDIDPKLFQFKEPDNAKIVDNPLTTE